MSTVKEEMANYLDTLGVTIEYSRGAVSNPKWGNKMNDWRVTIKRDNKRFDVDYFTGKLADDPNLPDVIHSLVSDRNTIISISIDSFGEWCYELGYDNDSITDLNTYNAIVENTERLEVMFTPGELGKLNLISEDY
jgi:hypothetical protein